MGKQAAAPPERREVIAATHLWQEPQRGHAKAAQGQSFMFSSGVRWLPLTSPPSGGGPPNDASASQVVQLQQALNWLDVMEEQLQQLRGVRTAANELEAAQPHAAEQGAGEQTSRGEEAWSAEALAE